MAVPKRKKSKMKVRMRKAQKKAEIAATTTCPECGAPMQTHRASPLAAAVLGRTLTMTAIMAFSSFKNDDDRLTVTLDGGGLIGKVVCCGMPPVDVKGYVEDPDLVLPLNEKGKLDVAGLIGKGQLTVIRDLGLKEPYTGSIELVSGEIAEDLTYYYAVSEQTPSSVALGVLMNKENTVRQAGGFMIQLMPGVSDGIVDRLEKSLTEMEPLTSLLDRGLTPEEILQDLLGPFGLSFTEKTPVSFFCGCTKEKVSRAIATLGRREILDLMLSQETVEAHCDYCNTYYTFGRDEMKQIYKDLRARDEAAGRKTEDA